MDEFSVAFDALKTRVEGLLAENAALQAQVEAHSAQDQAIADAVGKVQALTEEISSPPAAP